MPATILTTQGHASFQGDQTESFACRSLSGAVADWDPDAAGGGAPWMCSNNPNWINWIIEHGKRAIDAGADLIVLNPINKSSYTPRN